MKISVSVSLNLVSCVSNFISNCLFNFQISDKVSSLLQSRTERLGLITQVESALSLLNLRAVCEHGTSKDSPLGLQALVFGSDDFLVSIGNYGPNNLIRILFSGVMFE